LGSQIFFQIFSESTGKVGRRGVRKSIGLGATKGGRGLLFITGLQVSHDMGLKRSFERQVVLMESRRDPAQGTKLRRAEPIM